MEQVIEEKTTLKKPWLAGLLSLLCLGLGHFYIGQIKKAIGFHAGLWIYFLLTWFIPLSNTFPGLIIIYSISLVYGLAVTVNAVVSTRKNNRVPLQKYDKWYVYLLIVLSADLIFEFAYKPLKTSLAYFQSANIPTPAMSPTLSIGDLIIWRKTQSIQKGNLAVFEFSGEENTLYIFRCIASPGDNFELNDGLVFINGTPSDNAKKLKFRYLIRTNGRLNLLQLQKLGFEEINEISTEGYTANLTSDQLEELKKLEVVISITPTFMEKGTSEETIFPFSPYLKWNADFYGPFILPKKGQNIKIDKTNAEFYSEVIQMWENESQSEINDLGELVVNGKKVDSYTFKHNYFFMMGDNRHNAEDSRYRGPVPEEQIKGKVLYIWWSDKREKIGEEL